MQCSIYAASWFGARAQTKDVAKAHDVLCTLVGSRHRQLSQWHGRCTESWPGMTKHAFKLRSSYMCKQLGQHTANPPIQRHQEQHLKHLV